LKLQHNIQLTTSMLNLNLLNGLMDTLKKPHVWCITDQSGWKLEQLEKDLVQSPMQNFKKNLQIGW